MGVKWREDIARNLQDPEFARLYGAEQAKGEVAITLARARLKLGLTQKQMADKVGGSQPYIAKLERGDANPTVGNVGRMLAVLGLRLVVDTAPLAHEAPSALIEASGVAQHAWDQSKTVGNIDTGNFSSEVGTASEVTVLSTSRPTASAA